MGLSFRAELLVVDHLLRRSGPGRSHRSLPRLEVVAADRILDIDSKRTSSGSAQFHQSHIFKERGLSLPRNRYGETRVGSETKLANSKSILRRSTSAILLSALLAVIAMTLATPARA